MSVLLYGAETWTITSTDEQALGVFERKIDIYDDIDVVKRIKIQRFRWVMPLVSIASTQFVVFESEPCGGSRKKGRPRQRWAKQLTENVIGDKLQ